jgi:hypothetical protein
MYSQKLVTCVIGLVLIVSLNGCDADKKTRSQGSTATSPVEYSTSIEPKDLLGDWIAGNGKGVFEIKADGSLKITNETAMISSGKLSGDTLTAQEWNVTGRLSKDKKTLIWSSGFVWTRK